ncbi:MAG: DUF1080 domain-containing protein [Thermoguttaceae bacterium]|nr:DUF1080 domain-containing protein [Thermoguttaceae bacterium]
MRIRMCSCFRFLIAFLATVLLVGSSVIRADDHAVSSDQKDYIKKYAKQKNVPKPEEMLINTDSEPDLTQGFTELYNGKDLTGWVVRGGIAEFKAEGNHIVGIGNNTMKKNSFLATVRDDYKDFIFTCEIKMVVVNNSGIMFRAFSNKKEDIETVCGPQVEMEDPASKRSWSGGIYGENCGGWFYPLWLDAHKAARHSAKVGDWNRITIQAKGSEIKTWFNGQPATCWKNDEFQQGFFGLQVHRSKDGGVLHFRNIKVKEL